MVMEWQNTHPTTKRPNDATTDNINHGHGLKALQNVLSNMFYHILLNITLTISELSNVQ